MRKAIFLFVTLCSILTLSGCESENTPSGNTPESVNVSNTASEYTIPEVDSTTNAGEETIDDDHSSEEANEIAKKLNTESDGKYTKKESPDFDIEKEYNFSYLGENTFEIKSSLKNTSDKELYCSSTTFKWKHIKDSGIDGEIEIGSSEVLRCQITVDYGTLPSIQQKEYEVTENTLKASRKIPSLIQVLVDLQTDGFKEIQTYLKTINTSYLLW